MSLEVEEEAVCVAYLWLMMMMMVMMVEEEEVVSCWGLGLEAVEVVVCETA